MAQQIRFFEKNFIDINNESCSITVTDTTSTNNGQAIVDFIRNRSNSSAWVTSGSSDAANTQLLFELGGSFRVSKILLIEHNFKDFLLEYWDGGAWVTIENVTSNTSATTFHETTETLSDKLRLTIYATMIADDNKKMFQTIITRNFMSGQLESWCEVSGTYDQNKKVNNVLSGKANITQSVGAFTVDLKVKAVTSSNDLELFQEMYERYYEGFLMWVSGGEEAQFTYAGKLWRNKDIVLVKPINEYTSSWLDNIYKTGNPINIRLRETIR